LEETIAEPSLEGIKSGVKVLGVEGKWVFGRVMSRDLLEASAGISNGSLQTVRDPLAEHGDALDRQFAFDTSRREPFVIAANYDLPKA
jgi:hypothetical protein